MIMCFGRLKIQSEDMAALRSIICTLRLAIPHGGVVAFDDSPEVSRIR
jgi:hypothetical protein